MASRKHRNVLRNLRPTSKPPVEPHVPELRSPTEIPPGTSDHIAESIRRQRLEEQQRAALLKALRDQGLGDNPLIARRLVKMNAKTKRRQDTRRARLKGVQVGRIDREAIIARDESTCYLCGKKCAPPEIHLDHVIPISRGGAHTEDNIRVACSTCNVRKGAAILPSDHPAMVNVHLVDGAPA